MNTSDLDAEQFRRLVNSVTDHAIVMLDPDGIVTTWNPGAERLEGYLAKEILGRSFSLFYPPEAIDQSLPSRALRAAAEEGRFEDEGWRLRKDGSRFWANTTISPVRDHDGGLLGFAQITRDLTDRRKAELAQQQQSRRLTAILDCLSDAVAVCDVDGKFVHQNQAALSLAGPRHRDGDGVVDGVARYGIFQADGVTPFPLDQSTMLRALKGESTDNVEAVMRNAGHPEGIHLSVNGRALRDESGQIVGAVVIAHDISSRQGAERELVRQKTLLQSVLDCVVDTVSVYDEAGRMFLSNPAFDRMAGKRFATEVSAEERLRHYGLFTSDGTRRLSPEEAPAMRALRGETVVDDEVVVRSPPHPDGLVMSTNAQRLLDASGAVVGAVVTGRDVSARKRTDQALLEQQRLLSSILDCLGEGVVVYDGSGRMVLTNPAADRLVGDAVARNETLAERSKAFALFTLDGVPFDLTETAVSRALRGESSDDIEILLRSSRNVEGMPLSSSGRPLRDRSGQAMGAVVTIRDITVRRRIEKEREDLVVELHRSNEELEQFASIASHDLRAPLRAIENLTRWLAADLEPHFTPESAEYMRLLRSRVGRMDTLLGDLLEFSRVGRSGGEVELINLDKLIADVIELAAPPTTFQVARTVSVGRFETAPLPLKRVLLNLIANAVKHHDRGKGSVRITADENGPMVDLAVEDDGPGIPPEFHDKIFEMFQTLQPRDRVEGSGMGLAFVKKIVDQAGGTIRVESHGRGARFCIGWPRIWRARRA